MDDVMDDDDRVADLVEALSYEQLGHLEDIYHGADVTGYASGLILRDISDSCGELLTITEQPTPICPQGRLLYFHAILTPLGREVVDAWREARVALNTEGTGSTEEGRSDG